jgi:hypothetical protein
MLEKIVVQFAPGKGSLETQVWVFIQVDYLDYGWPIMATVYANRKWVHSFDNVGRFAINRPSHILLPVLSCALVCLDAGRPK